MKKYQLFASIVAVSLLTIGFGSFANASPTYHGYLGKVQIISDLETTDAVKETTGSAYNLVTYIQRGKLVSWVEKGTRNVTTKEMYAERTTVPMDYLGNASSLIGEKVHLNISTSIGTFESVDTAGTWTPN
ncbi:hypothetical protein GY31_14925 [Lysinibacillus sphaericus]|uniref:hypothetical protein n=1 Tax=Lysinibacillus TaxID=400634 RepID=UPI00084A9CF0|nr:hypothetical protein [Lysinibacillus sphaericus]OEC01552.1 hypothetical protein GY31_14925 [Lysinibacillus sphaericus]